MKHILSFIFLIYNLLLFSQDNEFVLVGYGSYENIGKKLYTYKQGENLRNFASIKDSLTANQDNIKLKLGIHFGLEFMIQSKDSSGTTNIKVKWEFPQKLDVTGKSNKENVLLYDFALLNNKYRRVGLELKEPDDLIPGIWTLSITYAADKTYVQKFYLYE